MPAQSDMVHYPQMQTDTNKTHVHTQIIATAQCKYNAKTSHTYNIV